MATLVAGMAIAAGSTAVAAKVVHVVFLTAVLLTVSLEVGQLLGAQVYSYTGACAAGFRAVVAPVFDASAEVRADIAGAAALDVLWAVEKVDGPPPASLVLDAEAKEHCTDASGKKRCFAKLTLAQRHRCAAARWATLNHTDPGNATVLNGTITINGAYTPLPPCDKALRAATRGRATCCASVLSPPRLRWSWPCAGPCSPCCGGFC